MNRTLAVAAWRVAEGDLTAGGARVISVVRNAATGHVHIALSTGDTLDLAGERSLMIAERTPQPAWWGRVLAVLTAAASLAAAIPDERTQADSAAILHAPSARETGRLAHVNAAPPNRPIRVVIADDNPLVPVGLRSLLEDDNRVVVVGEARSGGHALLVTRRLQPDVVLLDVPMATHDALPALPALIRLTRVLVLTYSRDPALLAQAMRRGATGYVVHAEYTTAKLVAAILDAHAGRRHLSPWAAGSLPAAEAPTPRSPYHGRRAGCPGGGVVTDGRLARPGSLTVHSRQ